MWLFFFPSAYQPLLLMAFTDVFVQLIRPVTHWPVFPALWVCVLSQEVARVG